MDACFFYEGTLRSGDNGIHMRGQSSGQNFGNELGHGVNQANWSEVRDVLGTILLGDEGDIRRIELVQISGI